MLRFPAKQLRAEVIRTYCRDAIVTAGVVCFSSGNAAAALREAGLDVVEVGPSPNAMLRTDRWWTHAMIRHVFPSRFDATSGHLPAELMVLCGRAYRERLGVLGLGPVQVPSGSGETLACLAMVYPDTEFEAVYDLDDATRFDPRAPLNELVERVASRIHRGAVVP